MLALRRSLLSVVVLTVALVAGLLVWRVTGVSGATAAPAAPTTPPAPPTTAATPSPVDEQADAQAKAKALADARVLQQNARSQLLTAELGQINGDFAVAITDNTSGITYAFHGDETFETASIVKVEILAALLLQQKGTISADQESLASAMICQSDNDAATTLWDEIGDDPGLNAASKVFGLTRTVAGTGGYWGETTTTVSDQARLLAAIADPKGPLGHANTTVTNLMGSVESDQQWGISAAAKDGETVILKDGWFTEDDDSGLWTVNSIGRITGPAIDATITILSSGNDSYADGISLVEQLATTARTALAI
jgi:beta-lactamase class A